MGRSRAVQVVLGEGEPGILRFVLEAEGFQVVGQARGEAELRRVLDATHPSVIVLDAGISASAAVDARSRSLGAQLVVVWPSGVRASVADDRVDPAAVLDDLGAAVRRAAERVRASAEDLVVLPESPAIGPVTVDEPHLMLVPDIGDEPKPWNRRRARQVLTVAAAWTLALTASAAIGLTLPRTFGLFEPGATPRPTVTSPGGQPKDEPASDPVDRSDAPEPKSCDPKEQTNGPSSGTGRPDDPGRGCGQGRDNPRGRPDDPGAQGNGGGRPEDPGNVKGNGRGADGRESDGNAQNAGSLGNGQNGGGHGNGGDAGSKGTSTSSDATESEDGSGKGNDRASGPG